MFVCRTGKSQALDGVMVFQAGVEQLSILLVGADDGGTSRLRQWLSSDARAFVGHADNDRSAAAILGERSWDLLVIDPAGCEGLEFIRQAKTHDRWLATLVVTGDHGPTFVERAVQTRIEGLMFEPVSRMPFMKRVFELAEESRDRRRRRQKRVLAIGAHPDDVEIGCGGTLAKHKADGDLLHILTLSLGSAGGDANVRLREALQAAELSGATIEFGNLPDSRISDGKETIDVIEAAIQEFQPTHIYTHSLEDTHQDHRSVHMATLAAARSVPNVYCYQAPSWTVEFRPNRFVDISTFVEAKLQAIGAHKSQVDRSASLGEDVIVSTARYWGRHAGCVMAEPLRVVRQRAGAMASDIRSNDIMERPRIVSIDRRSRGRLHSIEAASSSRDAASTDSRAAMATASR